LPLLLEKPERFLMPVPERMAIRPRFLAAWSPAREHRRDKACSYNQLRLAGLDLVLLTCGVTRSGDTQRTPPVTRSDHKSPNAPDRSASSEPTDDNVSNPQANSSISGTRQYRDAVAKQGDSMFGMIFCPCSHVRATPHCKSPVGRSRFVGAFRV
jgi:hypothetical protein